MAEKAARDMSMITLPPNPPRSLMRRRTLAPVAWELLLNSNYEARLRIDRDATGALLGLTFSEVVRRAKEWLIK